MSPRATIRRWLAYWRAYRRYNAALYYRCNVLGYGEPSEEEDNRLRREAGLPVKRGRQP